MRKQFELTSKELERRIAQSQQNVIRVIPNQSPPNNWKDRYGKTHFYHPVSENVMISSREIWDNALHTMKRK